MAGIILQATGDGATPVDDAEAQHDEAIAQGGGVPSHGDWTVGPVTQQPMQQGGKALADIELSPVFSFLGVGFLVEFA